MDKLVQVVSLEGQIRPLVPRITVVRIVISWSTNNNENGYFAVGLLKTACPLTVTVKREVEKQRIKPILNSHKLQENAWEQGLM